MAAEERGIYNDLVKDDDEEEIEEIAFLMDVEPQNLAVMFNPSNRALIYECLMKSKRFDLLTKYFNYDSTQNRHNSYRYNYIKPLRLLLYDLYGNITSNDNVGSLFAEVGVKMKDPQNLLNSLSDVEHRLAIDKRSLFIENLERALTARSFPSVLVKEVRTFREHYCDTEIDHQGRGSDMESGNMAQKSSGDVTTRRNTEPEYYPLNRSGYYGYCLIINNVEFEDDRKYPKRRGSEKDADDLKKLFEDLDYEVALMKDLRKDELVAFLGNLRTKSFSRLSVLVVFVLSHGEKDLFVLSDGNKMDFQTFQKFFMPNKIPSLAEKPKLFFIQACQGTESFQTFPIDMKISLDQDCLEADRGYLETDSESKKLPAESDFYFAVSTVTNYFSQRNIINGGWFIQSLVEVVKEHAKKHELHGIMTMVNNHLTQREGKNGQTQCSNVRKNTLRKIIYLGRPSS